MYCRKCGNKISDTEIYCQFCGTPIGQTEPPAAHAEETEGKEEIIFNPPCENHRLHHAERELRFAGEEAFMQEKEDLEFISENEMKEARRTQEKDAGKPSEEKEDRAGNPSHVKSSEFTWNVHEFPKQVRKTEEIEFNWNMEEFSRPEPQETAAATFEEELFREISEDSSRIKENNIDRFFTFSTKNEEFQKLLDKEYEKLNMRFAPEEESVIEQAVSMPEEDTPAESQPETVPEADHLSEMAQARTQFFGEELIKDNESIRRKLESPEQDGEPEPEQDKIPEPEQNIIPEQAEQNAESVSAEPEDEPESKQDAGIERSEQEPEETAGTGPAEEVPNQTEGAPEQQEDEPRRQEEAPEQQEEAPDQQEEAPDQPADTVDKPKQATDRQKEAAALSEETISLISQLFAPLEEEEAKVHKKRAGQIVLIVIAVILAIEIAILGIRYFAPNSMAAGIINQTQTQIFHTVSDWADGIKDLFSGKDANKDAATPEDNDQNPVVDNTQNGQPDEDQVKADTNPAAPDPKPAADKNALVASQLGNNKNIEQVKANEALAYQKGRDYGQADVNNSKPIENNIWQTPENGTAVYYDQSIVGTIISFDSQWIDYVNGGGKGVLDLLKKDSAAYRKTASFSKIGKIKEAFKLLEIGEIRQGAKGFYVWTHEELQVTENGKTAVMKYNWIYYLEPVEGKMKIVNYFKF